MHIFKYIHIIFLLIYSISIQAQQVRNVGIDEGLSGRQTYNIKQDRNGFVWIATRFGADRFDGESIKKYPINILYSGVVPVRTTRVELDQNNNLWLYTERGTIYRYDTERDEFICRADLKTYLRMLCIDKTDNIWVGIANKLSLLDGNTLRTKMVFDGADEGLRSILPISDKELLLTSNKNIYSYNIADGKAMPYIDTKFSDTNDFQIQSCFYDISQKRIFIGGVDKGLYVYDIEKKSGYFVNDIRLLFHPILTINKRDDNNILLGTDGLGMCVFNPNTRRVEKVYNHLGANEQQATGGAVYDIYRDNEGRFWLSTFSGGVSVVDFTEQGFKSLKHEKNNENSLSSNVVCDILEDSEQNLWFATNNGVSKWNHKTDKWQTLLEGKNTLSLFQDSNRNIWVGTYSSGIFLLNINGNIIKNYIGNSKSSTGPGTNFIYSISEDRQGNIWIGGKKGRASKLDISTQSFYHLPVSQVNCIVPGYLPDQMYLANEGGFFVVDINTMEVHMSPINKNLKSTFISDIFVQSDSIVWLATYGAGINRCNIVNGHVQTFTRNEGLLSDFVYALLSDDKKRIWFSSENGIGSFDLQSHKVVNFPQADEITGSRFRQLSKEKGSNGTFYFGSYEGVTYFAPQLLEQGHLSAKLFLQDFSLFNRVVKPGDENSPLEIALNDTEEIKLKYNQHSFSIDFTAIDYSSSKSRRYIWMLDGLDQNWTVPTSEHVANYTNINPGNYIFNVKYLDSNNNVIDSRQVKITVSPPFWNTAWAYILFLIIISGIAYFIYNYVVQKIKKKQSEEKIKFFINTAHDIRTPLTLISSPLYELKEEIGETQKTNYLLELITSNLDKLNKMFSQLLDFQKAYEYRDTLVVKHCNISKYLQEKHEYWRQVALVKKITMTLVLPEDRVCEWIDTEKLDKMLDNLISNAIKYTPDNGTINICLTANNVKWAISVKDNGIGISKQEQKSLFQRFFRASNAVNSQISGSGLGMLLVKQYATMHKASVEVNSVINQGSEFTISFLRGNEQYRDNVIIDNNDLPISDTNGDGEQRAIDKLKIKVLIAEDNADLRSYLKLSLSYYYGVYVAEDGQEAWESIHKINPDLIISDLQMPRMNGFELAEKIKNTFETSHIPIILLTVVNEKCSVEKGFKTGVDDYIEKPFDVKYLRVKVDNIIQNRKVLRLKYIGIDKNNNDDSEPESDLNADFLAKATTIIENNITDTSFSVVNLSREMSISRSLLYNKFGAITGYTPNDFIKVVKMNKAIAYFKEKKYSINEVSLMVGFDEPAYFSTCFKKIYGKTPKQFIEDNLK